MGFSKKDYIQLTGEIFEEVQRSRVFSDSKTFVDAVPKKDIEEIFELYKVNRDTLNLHDFIKTNFELPTDKRVEPELTSGRTMEEHIRLLWKYLKRDSITPTKLSSLIPLPKPYIIPGGRFREIYYWDSFFTMQGLVISGELETAENMIDNFAYLIDQIGHIPNGNRVYYISRSQPPFFAAMIDLLSKYKAKEWQIKYLPLLENEYKFWMNDDTRLIEIEPDCYLNRYYDSETTPREESYFEDYELAKELNSRKAADFYKNIRAACESGWDFSSRWFKDQKNIGTCETINIIPVDLNSLLYFLEKKLSELYLLSGKTKLSLEFAEKAETRKLLLDKYLWRNDCYFDFNLKDKRCTSVYSLASIYPLYFGLATEEKAANVSKVIESKFLRPGGVLTTLNYTGQQWDAPNGWPPLQWMTIVGLRNYGFNELANEVKTRWLKLNQDVFKRTGKMFEKYNVENITLFAGGGEYDLQDGFGWTNGVALALLNDIDITI